MSKIPGQEAKRESSGTRTVWVQPLATVFGWAIGLALFLYFFNAITTVLLGILAATIIAATLRPLLLRVPGPRGLAAAVLGLGLLATLGAFVLALSWPLAAPIHNAIDNWPKTKGQVNSFLARWSDALGIQQQPQAMSAQPSDFAPPAEPAPHEETAATSKPTTQNTPAAAQTTLRPLSVESLLGGVVNFLIGGGGPQLVSRSADVLLSVLISVALVLFGSIFILGEPADRLVNAGLEVLRPHHQDAVRNVLADLEPRFRRWVIGTLAGMCIVFTASLLGYVAIGLDTALPLAMLAGLAEVVPTVGPAVACFIATLFAAASQGGAAAVGVITVWGIIQGLEAYMILPLIMRGAVKIHPAVTLFTVVLWGKIFGLPGLILAIPINLTLWSLVHHFHVHPHRPKAAAAAPEADRRRSASAA